MKYAIFTDSTSDLTREECEQFGIWPEIFTQEVTCYGHQVDFSNADEFYAAMDRGEYPAGELKTASGNYEAITKILDDIIAQTKEDTVIVYASTSPHISSSTVTVGENAIEEYQKKHPERKFVHINSRCVSGGQAVFMYYLAKYGGDDIESYADELSKHCVHLFTLRDFRYARKSGRFNIVERIAMMTMTKLKISPWMYFPLDGKLSMNGQLFQGDKLLHEWAKYIANNRADDANYIRVCYGGAAEKSRAEKLIKLIKKHADIPEENIHLVHIGPIIASHTGSTVLAVFFKQENDRT